MFMRPHASFIERWCLRTLVLGLVLGALLALLSGLAMSPRTLAARADAAPGVTIVSPASASGPINTGIRVTGAGWNAGDSVQLYYYSTTAPMAPCDDADAQTLVGSQPIPGGAQVTIQSDGTWHLDFQWPSTTTGQFFICAFDPTAMQVIPSTQPFNVLSTTLPAIVSIMPSFPNVGDQITVQGSGFLPGGQAIDLKLATPGNENQAVLLGTATSDNSGNFTQMVTLPTTMSGNLELIASSRPSVSGALPPVIAVDNNLVVGATPSTATPGPTGTPTNTPVPTATQPAQATTGTGGSSGGAASAILDVLIFLLALVILAIFGVLIWYFVGIRPPAGVAAAAAPAAAPPRATGPSRRGMVGRSSQVEWPSDDWEMQQAPWEEDEQGAWSDSSTQWDDGAGRQFSGPSDWSGPQGRGRGWPDESPRPPSSRPPNRDDWQGRSRSGQDGR